MKIRYLDWDSCFFGLKIGQIDTDQMTYELYNELIYTKRKSGYDLVYWFAEYDGKNDPEPSGGKLPELYDVKITYSKSNLIPEENKNLSIEKYNGPLTGKLIELAIESGQKSRFRKDSRLKDRFVDMYTTWISRSVSGEIADVVLVSKMQNEINGFITAQRTGSICRVGLIAVDQMFRGRGIGGELLEAANSWCTKEGCNEIRVATQIENRGACRLYERNGYNRLSTKYIYHI
jgi:dTDP-4-amino-4,6-dideoxy-D-galactose acyltransferase